MGLIRDRYAIGLEKKGFSRVNMSHNSKRYWLYQKDDTYVWLGVKGLIRYAKHKDVFARSLKMPDADKTALLELSIGETMESIQVSMWLREDVIEAIKSYGDGNLTEGVRRLAAVIIPK